LITIRKYHNRVCATFVKESCGIAVIVKILITANYIFLTSNETKRLYNQKIRINYMVRTQLCSFTQNVTLGIPNVLFCVKICFKYMVTPRLYIFTQNSTLGMPNVLFCVKISINYKVGTQLYVFTQNSTLGIPNILLCVNIYSCVLTI
jgi:hypothetical protein